MLNRYSLALLLLGTISFIVSCSPKNISTSYYYQNEKVLDKMEETYKKLYQEKPFTVAFTDRKFDNLSLEIITDSISYIYQFNIHETGLADTLTAFKLNASKVVALIQQMRTIRCTWINKFDYYLYDKKNTLIMMSIKPVTLSAPFSYKRFYTLTYFPKPQYFDSSGQLLDKRRAESLRKINGEVFKRINSKVCYTISGNFR